MTEDAGLIILDLGLIFIGLYRIGFFTIFYKKDKKKTNMPAQEFEESLDGQKQKAITSKKKAYYERIEKSKSGIKPVFSERMETYLRRFFNAIMFIEARGHGNVVVQRIGDKVSVYANFDCGRSCIDDLAWEGYLEDEEFEVIGTNNDIFQINVPEIPFESWEGSIPNIILERMREPLPNATYSFTENNANKIVMRFEV